MREQLVCEHCPPEGEAALRESWEAERPRLERLLARMPADQRHVRVTLWPERGWLRTRIVLTMPTGTLVANGEGDTPAAAVDQAAERLVREIVRHKELLRREALLRRRRRGEAELAAAIPELEDDLRRRDRRAFVALLRPLLRDLREHARHELAIARLDGRIAPLAVTVADVFDEVLARAWARFDQRPVDRPLDQWLLGLLHEVLDESERGTLPSIDLAQPIPAAGRHTEPETSGVTESEPFWGPPEPLRIEDVLPAAEVPEVIQQLDVEDDARWIASELRDAPPDERRAFLLWALEGWSDDEIAMLLGRTSESVRSAIARVRARLAEHWHEAREGRIPTHSASGGSSTEPATRPA
jgi:DNA-directed RNA polymerase specialized sigma24 family protein/ribosome-associated translation inhibitor RaiA